HGARAAERVRLDLDVLTRAQSVQPFDRAGERDALDVVNAWDGCPVAVFVQPADLPFEVDAPGLRVFDRVEFHGTERNPDLGVPTGLRDPRGYVPDAVPVRVALAPFAD